MKNAEGCLAAIVGLVIGIPLAGFLYAWTAELNWNWFAVPILSLPRISFWQAYGIGLLLSSFVHHPLPKTEKGADVTESMVTFFLTILLRFGISVGFGYFVHQMI